MHKHPATYIGLTAAATFTIPTIAQAQPFDSVSVESFFVGFGSGLALAAAGVAIAAGVKKRRSHMNEQASIEDTSYNQVVLGLSGEFDALELAQHLPNSQVQSLNGAAHISRRRDTGEIRVQTPSTSASHAPKDLEQLASSYVALGRARERKENRKLGVAGLLMERLSKSRMQDLPIIQRADGSVGDVGTSWWEATVGAEAISKNLGIAEEVAEDIIPADFSAEWAATAEQTLSHKRESIAARISPVEQDAFPMSQESVTSSDDLWDSAMSAMEEKIAPEPVIAQPLEQTDEDLVDLTAPTKFIPFKVPAGHTEVVDTETYVDYLIRDEFSKFPSRSVRKTSRKYLTMLEGGTSSHSRTQASRPMYIPKHMAPAPAQRKAL